MVTVYSADAAALYDIEQSRNTEDIEFFVTMAQKNGGPVLDLGCGTGRLTLPMARAGMEVVALDTSASMLERLIERLGDEAPAVANRITIVRADMRDFALDKRFGVAICSSNTLLLLASRRSIGEALQCVGSHLLPSGRIIIDVAATDVATRVALQNYPAADIPDMELAAASGIGSLRRTHRITRLDTESNRRTDTFSITYKYFDHSDMLCCERRENIVLLTPEELLSLLTKKDYEILDIFGWYDRRRYGDGERKLIVVARRRERTA